jgi:hypothetical protein
MTSERDKASENLYEAPRVAGDLTPPEASKFLTSVLKRIWLPLLIIGALWLTLVIWQYLGPPPIGPAGYTPRDHRTRCLTGFQHLLITHYPAPHSFYAR